MKLKLNILFRTLINLSIQFIVIGVFSVNAVIFNCAYSNTYWNVVEKFYSCRPIVISTNNTSVLENVQGNHLSGKSNADVLTFSVYNQNLPAIVKRIENFFPNLIAFAWTNTGLTKISSEDLRPFPKLRYINFKKNNLTSLESDLFQHTSELEEISFNNNFITSVCWK